MVQIRSHFENGFDGLRKFIYNSCVLFHFNRGHGKVFLPFSVYCQSPEQIPDAGRHAVDINTDGPARVEGKLPDHHLLGGFR
mmetsp:Transcript_36176/g.90781  ORF Transcript_36176/g.90781 Transcript_36176/m.90781 type:complete len:82 (-) Transcript_36176:790-1035(-)